MKTPLLRLILANVVLAVLVLTAPHARPASSNNKCLTKSEYEIYEMILNERQPIDEMDAYFKSEHPDYVMPRMKFLITDKTVPAIGDEFRGIRPEYKPDSVDSNSWNEIIADLRRNPICTVEDEFSALVSVRITTQEEFDSLEGDEYGMFWENVRKKFGPSAVIHFSRVGFDTEGNLGAVYYDYMTGGLSGAGYTVVVERSGSSWHIREADMLWIS